jgi:hypothetical protein
MHPVLDLARRRRSHQLRFRVAVRTPRSPLSDRACDGYTNRDCGIGHSTAKVLALAKALLWAFHNTKSGLAFRYGRVRPGGLAFRPLDRRRADPTRVTRPRVLILQLYLKRAISTCLSRPVTIREVSLVRAAKSWPAQTRFSVEKSRLSPGRRLSRTLGRRVATRPLVDRT